MALSVTSTNYVLNTCRSQQNQHHPLFQDMVQKCVAAFLTLREMQSFGLTSFGQPEKMLGRGWVRDNDNPISSSALARVVGTRYPVGNPMPGNDFTLYEQLCNTRSYPELRSLNVLGHPELTTRMPVILSKTNLRELKLEGSNRDAYDWLLLMDRDIGRFVSDVLITGYANSRSGNGKEIAKLTDASLARLKDHDLQSLEIRHSTRISGRCLDHLKKGCLQSLRLECCHEFGDEGMSRLPQFPLRDLKLAHCPLITSAGWAHLAQLSQLESLDLTGCDQLTDDDLLHIAKLPLKYLNLEGCTKITKKGLKHIEGLSLTFSNFQGCSDMGPGDLADRSQEGKTSCPSVEKPARHKRRLSSE